MSKESLLRGITNDDLKRMVRKALDNGWEIKGFTGTTHVQLVWPKTGETVGFGTTISDRNYWKSFARRVESISGITMLDKHKHGKARIDKSQHANGYVQTYKPAKQAELAKEVERLEAEWRELVLEFQIIAMAEASRKDIDRCFKIVRRLADLERTFKMLHQPVPEMGYKIPGLEQIHD